MMRILALIILLLLLHAMADARARHPHLAGRRTGRIARTRQSPRLPVSCPTVPSCTWSCPDRTISITYAEQSELDRKASARRRGAEEAERGFEREFAAWLRLQPEMSREAAEVLKEAARQWYGRGARDGAKRAIEIEKEGRQ